MAREDHRGSFEPLHRAARGVSAVLEPRSAAIGFAVALFVAVLVVATGRGASPAVVAQPIAFNHRLHVEEVGLDCGDCHVSYETETFSGLPAEGDCALCHEEAQTESPEEAKLVALLGSGSLEWKPLFEQPGYVFYSHRRHVVVAGIECAECHGDFASRERPPERVHRLTMDECVECNERQQAGVDCTDCHR